jgi:hypothetical protein
MTKVSKLAGAVVSGVLLSGTAAAQSWSVHPELTDRYSLEAGAFFAKAKTTAHLNSSAGGTGTSVSFENLLGMEDSKTNAVLLGKIRFGDKWRVEAGYVGLDRSGSRAIGSPITWGNNTYPAGTTVSSEFKSDTFRISAGYSFWKDAKSEFGVALGLHTTQFEASLSAAGTATAKGDVLAPLPTLGVYGGYAFTPNWMLTGRVDMFSLNYDQYDGSLVDALVKIDYRFHRNFGVGLGYRYVDYDLSLGKSSFNGGVQYRYSGPVLSVTGSF